MSGDPFPPGERVDSFQLGLHDMIAAGWYNEAAGEVAPGFAIGPDDVVIDVGCGDGGMLGFCARRGAALILADIDGDKIAAAAERLAQGGARSIEAHVTDASPLPVADGVATRVICTEVLEHVDDPVALMAELVRVAAPGALFLISVPGHEAENIQRQLAPDVYFQKPNHIRIFETQAFETLVERAGLHIEARLPISFFWAVWWAFFWQSGADLGNVSHPTLDDWARTWLGVIRGRDGLRIKAALDGLMPKARAVVARKPA